MKVILLWLVSVLLSSLLPTSAHSQGSGTVDLTKLASGRSKIELGWTDFPPCSKLEMEEAIGPVVICSDGGQNCDNWLGMCITNAPHCHTETRQLGFQVPIAYVADQKAYAYAEVNLPQVPQTIDALKVDVGSIIDRNIRNALSNHINVSISNFTNDIKVCAISATTVSVVNAIVTGGSAALPTFMGVWNLCLDVALDRFTTDLFSVPTVISNAISNTTTDLKKYLTQMVDGDVNVYGTSTCGEWRRL